MGSGNEDRSTTHGRELCSHNADLKGELKRFRPIRDRSSEIEKNRRRTAGQAIKGMPNSDAGSLVERRRVLSGRRPALPSRIEHLPAGCP
jgi:hypothetical protein